MVVDNSYTLNETTPDQCTVDSESFNDRLVMTVTRVYFAPWNKSMTLHVKSVTRALALELGAFSFPSG